MALNDAMRQGLQKALNENGIKVNLDKPKAPQEGEVKVGENGLPEGAEEYKPKTEGKEIPADKSAESSLPPGFEGVDLGAALDEAPAPEAPEPEPEAGDEPEPTTKDGKAFAAMRKQIKELTERLNLLKHVESKPTDTAQFNELQEALKAKDAEIEKLADQIGALDLERDPRFVAKYKQADDMLLSQIKDTAKEFGLADEVVDAALSYPLKKRLEYLTEEAGGAAPMLLTLFAQRDAIMRQKQGELAKHREVRQQLDQQRGTTELALEQQARSRLFEGALTTAREQGHFVFVPVEGNAGRNALVDKAVGLAKDLFTSNDGQRQAQAMMLGVAAPVYLHMLKAERARVKQLEAELQSRFGKRATVGAGAGATSGGGAKESPKSMTPDEAAAAFMQKIKIN